MSYYVTNKNSSLGFWPFTDNDADRCIGLLNDVKGRLDTFSQLLQNAQAAATAKNDKTLAQQLNLIAVESGGLQQRLVTLMGPFMPPGEPWSWASFWDGLTGESVARAIRYYKNASQITASLSVIQTDYVTLATKFNSTCPKEICGTASTKVVDPEKGKGLFDMLMAMTKWVVVGGCVYAVVRYGVPAFSEYYPKNKLPRYAGGKGK